MSARHATVGAAPRWGPPPCLQGLLSRTAITADLVAADVALIQQQAELESLRSQRAALAGRIFLAMLALDVGVRADTRPQVRRLPETLNAGWGPEHDDWCSTCSAGRPVAVGAGGDQALDVFAVYRGRVRWSVYGIAFDAKEHPR